MTAYPLPWRVMARHRRHRDRSRLARAGRRVGASLRRHDSRHHRRRARPRSSADERYRRSTLFAVFAVTVVRLLWLAAGADRSLSRRGAILALVAAPGLRLLLEAAARRLAHRGSPPALGGDDEFAVGLAAPLLHFGDGAGDLRAGAAALRCAQSPCWSAVIYVTLPGVSVSAIIISTDAPLLFCWAVALYAFVRAREPGGGRWWLGGRGRRPDSGCSRNTRWPIGCSRRCCSCCSFATSGGICRVSSARRRWRC